MDATMVADRRTPTRIRARWPVVVLTGKGVILAETRDISSEGVFISCEEPLNPEEKLRVFIMAPNHRPLEIAAVVAWSNPHGLEQETAPKGMGLRFTKDSSDQCIRLQDIVAQHYKTKTASTVEKK
jgi:Tfp pilus assembly protein PilZ